MRGEFLALTFSLESNWSSVPQLQCVADSMGDVGTLSTNQNFVCVSSVYSFAHFHWAMG